MNCLSDPNVLDLADAARTMPGGPVSTRTMLDWAKNGVHGVKLEACRVGHRWKTSREAIARFLAKLNEPAAASA
jgi:hypothetical protein